MQLFKLHVVLWLFYKVGVFLVLLFRKQKFQGFGFFWMVENRKITTPFFVPFFWFSGLFSKAKEKQNSTDPKPICSC